MTGLIIAVYSLAWVPVPVWIVLGFLALLAVSLGFGLLVGRMIRVRDAQVPRGEEADRGC